MESPSSHALDFITNDDDEIRLELVDLIMEITKDNRAFNVRAKSRKTIRKLITKIKDKKIQNNIEIKEELDKGKKSKLNIILDDNTKKNRKVCYQKRVSNCVRTRQRPL